MLALTTTTENMHQMECDSDSENEKAFSVRVYTKKEKPSQTKKILVSIAVVVFFAFCIVITVTLWPRDSNSTTWSHQKAFYTLQDLMDKEYFHEDDDKAFRYAFNTFDTNKDGYLNETEFTAFIKMELEHSRSFEAVDADRDDVISYPEAVAYVKEMHKISSIKENSLNNMLDGVQAQYGFLYVNESQSFDAFIEYIAIAIYFESFDTDLNGYIHHDEYSTMAAKYEFAAYDLEENGEISRDVFFDILYGDDEYSWKGKLRQMFGDKYHDTMHDVGSILITNDLVKDTQTTLCPVQILRKHLMKRRLACSWSNELVYDSSCNCWTYKMVYRCTW